MRNSFRSFAESVSRVRTNENGINSVLRRISPAQACVPEMTDPPVPPAHITEACELYLAGKLKNVLGCADHYGYTKLLSLPRTSFGVMRWCATVSSIWLTDCENAVSTRGESVVTRGRRAVLRTEARTTRSPLAATSLTMWCSRAGVLKTASILESSARSVGRTIMCTRKRPIG
jgi:hypothetical protein